MLGNDESGFFRIYNVVRFGGSAPMDVSSFSIRNKLVNDVGKAGKAVRPFRGKYRMDKVADSVGR